MELRRLNLKNEAIDYSCKIYKDFHFLSGLRNRDNRFCMRYLEHLRETGLSFNLARFLYRLEKHGNLVKLYKLDGDTWYLRNYNGKDTEQLDIGRIVTLDWLSSYSYSNDNHQRLLYLRFRHFHSHLFEETITYTINVGTKYEFT